MLSYTQLFYTQFEGFRGPKMRKLLVTKALDADWGRTNPSSIKPAFGSLQFINSVLFQKYRPPQFKKLSASPVYYILYIM